MWEVVLSNYYFGNTADEIYTKLYNDLTIKGRKNVSGRNGDTTEILHVDLSLENPRQRWVCCRQPVISPAFSFAELITIMNGCDDAKVINPWNSALPRYQGNYNQYPGAYGARLRKKFGFDQLQRAYEALLWNSHSRQVVLEIWKPDIDLPVRRGIPNNKDIPCNICSMLKIRDDKLYWTQIMRSNDIFLGLPYNLLQFTSLQEIMAGWLKLELGEYMHISDSMHIYNDNTMTVSKEIHMCNEDNLSLEKQLSDNVFYELYRKLIELGESSSVTELVKNYLKDNQLPVQYNNILMILCIYMLHKKDKTVETIEQCFENCQNELYNIMMRKWIEEKKKSNCS